MRNHSLDTLIDLDGTIFFLVEGQGYWVKFDVKRVATSAERPHGLKYSQTLYDPKNRRIVGFDNGHEIATGSGPGKKSEWDHKHRFKTIKPYDYADAASLLTNFWEEVEGVLNELGVMK